MDGIERIKVLSSEVKDEALLAIIDYLVSRKDMNDKYLNEEKSLQQMIDFIMSEAKKKAKDNRAIVKDEVVFGWAIHYWDEPNDKLEINKVAKAPTKSSKKVATEEPKKPTTKPKTKDKNWQPEGQLTLFDLM